MVTASAPGKVYCFGEHAVVYGEPAIPCAIDRRARVTVTERADSALRISADDLSLEGFTVAYDGGPEDRPNVDAPESLLDAAMGYVRESIAQVRDLLDRPEAGFDVEIHSEIPLGAGLGSSAAVTVAAITAAAVECGHDPDPAIVADRAFQVEHSVQDGEASRADTFCSAMGGAVRVEGEDCRRLEDVPTLEFVVGYDGGAGDTGALVRGVRADRDRYDSIRETIDTIGAVVREGQAALEAGDRDAIGRCMDVNHGLLSALGVSARSLDAMVWAARDGGARGAKLTGAGGGGCIVALGDGPVRRALEFSTACEQAFATAIDRDGVRVEQR
ncbi:mevalonate kinase [Halococcoides cellulosivorans]|uniref:Mevalonate kinase n=1 Tax=Halococcoides cellulosivorans TaxID=1679096 RepID=A0A2R4X0D4_9EURY|nr:mevalonate kinase [Halococcoides cellulosivorans]AWB27254.1 mevalonate kinase [Halococcoides cellulosivorans]